VSNRSASHGRPGRPSVTSPPLRGYLRASHKHRPIEPVRLPAKPARAFRAGANLAPERAVGRRTWENFLAARVNS
ncbi:MAG: hypothetical protein M3457_19455, partial [Chloroflexota bacterium]|nr:hypothetical protein [Chloroflexota bacterium]